MAWRSFTNAARISRGIYTVTRVSLRKLRQAACVYRRCAACHYLIRFACSDRPACRKTAREPPQTALTSSFSALIRPRACWLVPSARRAGRRLEPLPTGAPCSSGRQRLCAVSSPSDYPVARTGWTRQVTLYQKPGASIGPPQPPRKASSSRRVGRSMMGRLVDRPNRSTFDLTPAVKEPGWRALVKISGS